MKLKHNRNRHWSFVISHWESTFGTSHSLTVSRSHSPKIFHLFSGLVLQKAQYGLTLLKDAIRDLLVPAYPMGLKNVDVGKALGLYSGHKRHEGHISRTLLEIIQNEGIIEQQPDKLWYYKEYPETG